MDAIHQFHSAAAPGDAVTNSMLLTQDLIRELGFKSEIYVEHTEAGLQAKRLTERCDRGIEVFRPVPALKITESSEIGLPRLRGHGLTG